MTGVAHHIESAQVTRIPLYPSLILITNTAFCDVQIFFGKKARKHSYVTSTGVTNLFFGKGFQCKGRKKPQRRANSLCALNSISKSSSHTRNCTHQHQYKWETQEELSQPMYRFQNLRDHNNWQNLFARGQDAPKRLPFTWRNRSTNGNAESIHRGTPFLSH